MPYTKGNIVHTLICAILWVIPCMLISSYMAPVCTQLCANTGLFLDQIAAGAQFTNWEEGGNILMWILTLVLGGAR